MYLATLTYIAGRALIVLFWGTVSPRLLAGLPRRLGAAGPSGSAGGAVWALLVDLEGGLPRLGFLPATSCIVSDLEGRRTEQDLYIYKIEKAVTSAFKESTHTKTASFLNCSCSLQYRGSLLPVCVSTHGRAAKNHHCIAKCS